MLKETRCIACRNGVYFHQNPAFSVEQCRKVRQTGVCADSAFMGYEVKPVQDPKNCAGTENEIVVWQGPIRACLCHGSGE